MSTLTLELVALLGGIQTVLAALFGFLGKVWLERILESEKAKLHLFLEQEKAKMELVLQKSLHMHKTQYDAEFKVCTDLWKELCGVRTSIRKLSFPRERDSDSGDLTLAEKRAAFNDAVSRLSSLTELHRPFFAAEIAKLLFELVALAYKEKERDERDRERREVRLHAETVRNLHAMKIKSDQICEAIRERLTGNITPVGTEGT